MAIKLMLGNYPVISVEPGVVVIDLGRNVQITMHHADIPHTVKRGDLLPLYVEVPFQPQG